MNIKHKIDEPGSEHDIEIGWSLRMKDDKVVLFAHEKAWGYWPVLCIGNDGVLRLCRNVRIAGLKLDEHNQIILGNYQGEDV